MSLALKTEGYKSEGGVKYTAGSAKTAGIPIIVGGRVCVPRRDLASGETDELQDYGRMRAVKKNEVWAPGQLVGYDSDADPAVGTAGSGAWTNDPTAWDVGTPPGGIVELAAAAGDEQGIFLLNEFKTLAVSAAVAASAAISNTVAETAFDKTHTIPADNLQPVT